MTSRSLFATRLLVVACVMLLALESGFCERISCTPSTCPDGPVWAYFQYSNCTGDVTFETTGLNFGVCESGELAELSEVGYVEYYFETSTCDYTLANVSFEYESYWFGRCSVESPVKRASHAAASMLLPNVNASFVSPQNFDNQPIPAYASNSFTCDSVDNCTYSNGEPAPIWYTEYSQLNCVNPSYSYASHAQVGVCVNYRNETYQMVGCIDEHTHFEALFSDAQCTQPIYAYGYRYVCSSESYYTTWCTAPAINIWVEPPSPSSPVSSAPHSQPLSFFILSIACLLLILFNF